MVLSERMKTEVWRSSHPSFHGYDHAYADDDKSLNDVSLLFLLSKIHKPLVAIFADLPMVIRYRIL